MMNGVEKRVLSYCQMLVKAFNNKDSKACAEHYDDVAMLRSPQRQFIIGAPDICQFWQEMIAQSSGLAFIEKLSVMFVAEDYFIVESLWDLNNGRLLSLKETWCETDGQFKIIEQRVTHQHANVALTDDIAVKKVVISPDSPITNLSNHNNREDLTAPSLCAQPNA